MSAVLADVPARIHCTSLLPDQKTIRFVWGSPRRAEDVDTTTGRRVPSPLVPEAYAETCPDVSPDGKRMVFTGRTPDKRAFVFVGERADGSDAVPVVQVAEPTMSSDPTWMADGQSFSYEADLKHMGAFSMVTKRAIVLPQATSSPSVGSLRHVVRDQVFVVSGRVDGQGEVLGLAWPSLEEQVRFRFRRPILDVQSRDGRTYYCTTPAYESSTPLLAITPSELRGKPTGAVRDQLIRYPRFVTKGLSFVSIRFEDVVSIRASDGHWEPLAKGSSIIRAVSCGAGLAVTQSVEGRRRIGRFEAGRLVSISEGPEDADPACSGDGRVLFYMDRTSKPAIHRCDAGGCRSFAPIAASELAVSPDGERLAFTVVENRGPMVQWMSTRGGSVHDVVETETLCRPGWSSNRTLWVSRREGKNIVWTEVEADAGRPTGKRIPGSHDCFDGGQDPASPVDPHVRLASARRSQLRFLPMRYLEEP